MTELAVGCLLLVGVMACSHNDLLSSAPPEVAAAAPPDLRAACATASYRCSQCHSLDPVMQHQAQSPGEWRRYVKRMRRMPGARITDDEETPIVQCLVYRSFGLAAARAVTP